VHSRKPFGLFGEIGDRLFNSPGSQQKLLAVENGDPYRCPHGKPWYVQNTASKTGRSAKYGLTGFAPLALTGERVFSKQM
jgi:hypothetical protein